MVSATTAPPVDPEQEVGHQGDRNRQPGLPVGTGRRLATVAGRLELAKQIGHAHHATANDVVLAAATGGLRALFGGRGEDVLGRELCAMVTISLHQQQPGQAQGNMPGWMMVPLPLSEPDPVRRLDLISAQTAERKHKLRPQAGSGIFRFIAGQRIWYRPSHTNVR